MGHSLDSLAAFAALGSVVITALALLLAIVSFAREYQISRLRNRMTEFENYVLEGERDINLVVLIDSICHAYLSDAPDGAETGFVVDLFQIRVRLNEIVFSGSDQEVVVAVKTINNFAHELAPEFTRKVKLLYASLNHEGRFHNLNLDKWIAEEYKNSFEEDLEWYFPRWWHSSKYYSDRDRKRSRK